MNNARQGSLWIIDNAVTGPQRWFLKDKRFTEVTFESGDSFSVDDHPEFDFLGPHYGSHCIDPDCPTIFPGTFEYCPFCGKEIGHDDIGSAGAVEQQWNSQARGFAELPFMVTGVSPPLRRNDGQMAYDVRNITLPQGGPFAFMVGGSPRRLYAFDRESCILWAKELLSERWRELAKLPPAESLPSWSWAVAQGATGFALVTKNDIFWISLPWRYSGEIPPMGDLAQDRRFLAGAGQSGEVVAAPLLQGGRLAVAWRNSTLDEEWRLLESVSVSVGGGETRVDGGSLDLDWLGAPVQDLRGNLYWAGANGFLVCEISGGSLQKTRWTPWLPNHGGRPEFRPLKDIQGRIYQLTLGTSRSETRSRAHSLSGTTPRSEPVHGPFFSSGFDTFYENYRYSGDPWDGYPEPTDLFDSAWPTVFPLLALGFSTGNKKARQLFYARTPAPLNEGWDANKRFQVDVYCRNVDGSTIEVKRGLSLSWPSDLSVFYYDKRMYLYNTHESSLWCWGVTVKP